MIVHMAHPPVWKNEYIPVENEDFMMMTVKSIKDSREKTILIDNNPALLEILSAHYWFLKVNEGKGKAFETYSIVNKGGRNVKNIIYDFFHTDQKRSKHRLLLKDYSEPQQYTQANLTSLFKKSAAYKVYEENFKLVGKARREKADMTKRMKADYSKSLSVANSKSGREKSTLDWEDVYKIRKLFEGNMSQQELADKYNMKRTTIADIVNYRIWNEHLLQPFDLTEDAFKKKTNLELMEYDEDTCELQLKDWKGFEETLYAAGGYLYLLIQNEDGQRCLMKFDLSGKYLSDCHIRFVEPSHRTKGRDFAIISLKGNSEGDAKMTRKEVYDVLYTMKNQ